MIPANSAQHPPEFADEFAGEDEFPQIQALKGLLNLRKCLRPGPNLRKSGSNLRVEFAGQPQPIGPIVRRILARCRATP
jgi:hypothetical protein